MALAFVYELNNAISVIHVGGVGELDQHNQDDKWQVPYNIQRLLSTPVTLSQLIIILS